MPCVVIVTNGLDRKVTVPSGSAGINNEYRFGLDLIIEGPNGVTFTTLTPPSDYDFNGLSVRVELTPSGEDKTPRATAIDLTRTA